MNNAETVIKNTMRVLLGATRPLTLAEIAGLVGMSKRSVQNYLGRIEEWVEANALPETSLAKKQGVGISLASSPADRRKMERLLANSRLNVFSDDFKRRADIVWRLLLADEELTIQKLADQGYVSRTTTVHDLEWAGQWCQPYGLKLYKTQRRGIGLAGTEAARRRAIAAYFDLCNSGERIPDGTGGGRLSEGSRKSLLSYYPQDTIRRVEGVIAQAEKKFNFFMMEDYYVSLVTHLIICVTRIEGGNPVSEEFAPPDEEFPKLESQTAAYIAELLQREFGVRLDDKEKAYICIHIMGYNAFSMDTGEISVPDDVERLATALIEHMDRAMGDSEFSRDVMLFLGLCMHLKTTVFRLRNSVYLKKRQGARLPDAKLACSDAAAAALPLYREICGVTPDDEELSGVVQYFLLSRRRNLHRKKALLVCDRGIFERIALLNEVEIHISGVSIVDCCTALQMPYQPDYEYDFIITTEDLFDRIDKPVVFLSGIPKERYIDTVAAFVAETF